MPIDIWFTRSDSVEGIVHGAASENDLPRLEFLQALRESMARHGVLSALRPDGTTWATHAAGSVRAAEPWYAARFVPTGQGRGHGLVSFSLTSRAMPEDVESFLEPASEVGRALRCRVFDGRTGVQVTAESVKSQLAPGGAWGAGLRSAWTTVREGMNRRNLAALELPVGGKDETNDFFVWSLGTAEALPPFDELLAPLPEHLIAHAVGEGVVLEDRRNEQGVVRVFPVGPRKVQVWPYWSDLPFSALSAEVLAALERIAGKVGGEALEFCGAPCPPERLAAVVAHSGGLAIDLLEWLTGGAEPAKFA